MPQTNGYGLLLTKLFTSTAARLCVGYDPQVPPCSQRMAAQPAYRETVQGVIGWQSCLLQQLQGSVWVTIHRYHHAAKGWQHSPHTESGSTACIQRDSPGGHWDYVPLGESIRPPRDDHTPRIQKICHISCEVWQRISVSHRVQHMWLMPFVSSMVSLSQPYPPFSINITLGPHEARYLG